MAPIAVTAGDPGGVPGAPLLAGGPAANRGSDRRYSHADSDDQDVRRKQREARESEHR
jgi:hypothetical protein